MRKFIISLVVLFGVIQLSAYGQSGFAGPDKKLTRAGCDEEGDEVCVSVGTENDPLSCYEWTPSTGIKNPESGITEACPEETTNYKLTKTSPDGNVHIDYVKIEVVTEIDDVTATPKKCCYQEGDKIEKKDFEFSPAGIEGCVTVLTPSASGTLGSYTMDAEFELKKKDGSTIKFKTEIAVAPSVSAGGSAKLNEVKETIKKFETTQKLVKRYANKLHKLPGTKAKSGTGKDLKFNYSLSTKCCSSCEKEVPVGINWSASLSGSVGYSASYDIRCYGIPYIAEVGVRLGAGGSIGAELKSEYTFFCDEGSLSIPAKAAVEIYGGIYGKLLVVLEASATVNFGLEGSFTWQILPEPKADLGQLSGCGDIKLVGTVTCYSLIERKIEYVLYKKCL